MKEVSKIADKETIKQVRWVVNERLGLGPKSIGDDTDLGLFTDALSLADTMIHLEDRYTLTLNERDFGMRPGIHVFELGVKSRPEGYTIRRIAELIEKRQAEEKANDRRAGLIEEAAQKADTQDHGSHA